MTCNFCNGLDWIIFMMKTISVANRFLDCSILFINSPIETENRKKRPIKIGISKWILILKSFILLRLRICRLYFRNPFSERENVELAYDKAKKIEWQT